MHTLELIFFAIQLSCAIAQIISGDPPSFPNTDNPQDQFVFRVDDDGNPVDLVFTCPVEGTGPPTINWYRKVGNDFVLDNMFKREDGSYVFPNITEEHTAYASGDGVQYYCTATNDYGTIRSRTVRAVYAAFNGFLNMNGQVADPIELDDEGTLEPVDVRDATVSGRLQFVALQCPLASGSTPTPAIQWIIRDTVADSRDILTETETSGSRVRFLDDGEWLIMETPTSRITNKQYYCQVTNVRRFNTERGPITYTLNPVTDFNGENIRVYRNLTSRAVPASSTDAVRFGTAIASSVDITYDWRLDGSQSDSRLDASGPTADITPEGDNVINIQLRIIPDGGTTITQTATLTLQDPAVLVAPTPVSMEDVLSGGEIMYTCNAGGFEPDITFFHNGVVLDTNNSPTYTITSSTSADSGMYQCLVENDSGSQEASWFLIVRDSIKPDLNPLYTTDMTCRDTPLIQQNEGPIVLIVNVTADPCPTVVWTVDGAALPDEYTADDGCMNRPLGDTLFTFTLTVATPLPTKPTAISATFTNVDKATSEVVGSTELSTVYVVGQVRASISGLVTDPDRPIAGTDQHCLSADSTVQITCENVGYPLPTVVFRRNLEPIDVTGDNRFFQGCNTLTITGVVAEDEGSYDCTVENIPNDPETVEDRSEPPLKLAYCIAPTTGNLIFTNKNPTEGGITVASCELTGSPSPVITWIKDGIPLDEITLPSRFRITEDTTERGVRRSNLEIYGIELADRGNYSCNVSNAVGFTSRHNYLEVQASSGSSTQNDVRVGLSVGLSVLGLFIFLSVIAVSLTFLKVYMLSIQSKASQHQGTTTLINNVTTTREIEMKSNSAYVSQTTRNTDNDTSYYDNIN